MWWWRAVVAFAVFCGGWNPEPWPDWLVPCAPLQSSLNVHANFSRFGLALLTLFRIATGEGWEAIMFDCMNEEKGGSKFAPLYFSSFVVIATFILINLFVMIIVEDFDEVDRQSRGLTNHTIDAFKLAWAQYDPFGRKEIEWRFVRRLFFVGWCCPLSSPVVIRWSCQVARSSVSTWPDPLRQILR